ncbi:MAG: response regulator [Cytophagales bacterium]|nr:response regulator [Cytophagales bacterium]
MKAIIVDDEPMARMALRSILKMHFPHVEVLAECKNVPEAVKQINDLRPQVVFLDIEMPEYTGFDLLNFFRPEHIDFEIIFVTAYNEYALRAFEISAVDYLLKPFDKNELEQALVKYERRNPGGHVADIEALAHWVLHHKPSYQSAGWCSMAKS